MVGDPRVPGVAGDSEVMGVPGDTRVTGETKVTGVKRIAEDSGKQGRVWGGVWIA